MTKQATNITNHVTYSDLNYALHHCVDLPMLQNCSLVKLPTVSRRIKKKNGHFESAKALKQELISCAGELTKRKRYPIKKIIFAIEKDRHNIFGNNIKMIQSELDLPFSRDKIDLARYYSIRLVMEGVKYQSIAEFLDVEVRTVSIRKSS